MENNEKKVLLSAKDVHLQFKVRGRILTAIRGISLDIYEEESIAIVGESGSGKSVFTKCFTGMNDNNGYISGGEIIYNDPELADTHVALSKNIRSIEQFARKRLDENSKLELGAETYKEILKLESEKKEREGLSNTELEKEKAKEADILADRTDAYNLKLTLDSKKDKAQIKELNAKIDEYDAEFKSLRAKAKSIEAEHKKALKADTAYLATYNEKMEALKSKYQQEISGEISDEVRDRNVILAKEICLSIGRYGLKDRYSLLSKLLKALKKAMQLGIDLNDDKQRNAVFDTAAFRVQYLDETEEALHGTCVLNLANVKFAKDWAQIRGKRIATVFQDPMTSLNPIITIGKQITSIIIKHQGCSEVEARRKALDLMHKVGIPNPEKRFDDYPFQYSGGMRQRIVIAIALSCQPKILICDEPTTALDVTIQAQILKLLKDLQKEFHYTIVFITHDLGVVANIADRVAVLYAGQIVELGTVEEVFYDPKHPYTWALLSSLPQLTQRNTKLYSITGTPPSLYNEVVGDAFAPRNPYCLKIDTLEEPPLFKVSETHYAKTWLLDPDASKVEKPEAIDDIHGKLIRAFNI